MTESGLTAIIPTHNRPQLLMTALESVRAQTVPVKVIVVDDGSDPAVQAADLPAGTSIVRHDTAMGPAAARNLGAEAATSEWLGFLDDDDIWLPKKVESVLEAARRFPEAEVIFNGSSYHPSRRDKGTHLLQDPMRRVLRTQPPHISGVSVRRAVHLESPFDETMWATQDLDYLIRLAHFPSWVEIRRDLTRHMDPSAEESAINIESRIAGRLSLMDRHGDLIRADRVAHSFFYVRLGYQYRRGSHYPEARASFIRALQLRPTSGLAWRGLLRVLFA
ncbi:MAG: glycosyltransferase family 2 protein [Acidimicrobiia bacterium]